MDKHWTGKRRKSKATKLPREVKIITMREVGIQLEPLDTAEKMVNLWRTEIVRSIWYEADKEQMVCVCLDTKLRLKALNLVSIGLVNQTLVHAREVFRPAIAVAAVHIAILHNHPSGDPAPSQDDIKASMEMVRAGTVLGIPLIDSIVVGQPSRKNPLGAVSLKELGLLRG